MDIPCPVPDCAFSSSKRMLLHHLRHGHVSCSAYTCKIDHCHYTYSSIRSYEKHLVRDHLDILSRYYPYRQSIVDTHTNEAMVDNSFNIDSFQVKESCYSKTNYKHMLVKHCLKLKEKYVLSNATYLSIMDDTIGLFSSIQADSLSLLKTKNVTDTHLNDIPILEKDFLVRIWSDLKSPKCFTNHCNALGMVQPVTHCLNDNSSFQYVPILDTLKHYFSHPDVFMAVAENNATNKTGLSDFTQGRYFQEHPYFQGNKSLIRLHFYFDELELCNPLGSSKSKNKLACFYFFVGNVGSKHCSNLSNIFVALIVKAETLKKHCLNEIVAPLLDDINKFQFEGIVIKKHTHLSSNDNHLFGSIATISADNLGAHQLAGLRRCFSSGRICRFCMCVYSDLKVKSKESDFTLRTPAVHRLHVKAVTKDKTLTPSYGVVEACAFDILQGFSPVTAFPPDLMHDCLEGVLPRFLQYLFRHLHSNAICIFDKANEKLKKFKFGRVDRKNKPRPLPGNVILSGGRISLTASETLCLFRSLPFIIGDIVPASDEAWSLYIKLSGIMDIILAPSISTEALVNLKILIEEFYLQFAQFAPDLVKPKLHFFLHYPNLIKMYGPLRHLWCMRFESFHRKVKLIAHNCQNFKNICLTVTKRIQSLKCYEQCNTTCLTSSNSFEGIPITMDQLPDEIAEFLQFDMNIPTTANLVNAQKLVENGVTYAVNNIYVLDCLNSKPMFVQVIKIILFGSLMIICGKLLRPIEFLSHLHSYVIDVTDMLLFFKPGSEICPYPHDMYNCNGKHLIRLRYQIYV